MSEVRTLVRKRRSKTCSLCGAPFGCAHGAPGCWCEGVAVGRETLTEIRQAASDCICPQCLEDFAKSTGGARSQTVSAKAIPDATVRARVIAPLWAAIAIAFLLGSLLVGLAIGPAQIRPGAIIGSVLTHLGLHVAKPLGAVDDVILWQVRAPRVALAALVGGMLAVAGSAYQGVFRNPLADPYLLGVAAGAGLGATLAIASGTAGASAGLLLPVAAFAGACLAVAAAYVLGRSTGGAHGATTLILAGIVIALFMTAVQTFVQQQRSETLREVYAWILGGFGTANWQSAMVVIPYVAVSSAVILLHRRVLDVLRLGDDEASSLGIKAGRARLALVFAATLGTAAAVAVSGLIGFVGIIVPHTIRLLISPSYRAIVPLSLLSGAGFLVLADALARTILSPAELPIGVVTAFFGAPFFAMVLRSTRGMAL